VPEVEVAAMILARQPEEWRRLRAGRTGLLVPELGQAGLQAGDIVTSFDDRLIANSTELVVAIRSNEPGQTVPVTVSRDGSDVTVDLTLGSQKG